MNPPLPLPPLLLALCLLAVPVRAGGPLTPPGPPGVTFKSLHEVEPRSPVTGPTNISVSGSYYLMTNLFVTTGDAILITADNVTLDLRGFSIVGSNSPSTGTTAVRIEGARNVSVFNGHIRGFVTNNQDSFSGAGFADGIAYNVTAPDRVRVRDVSISGVSSDAIFLRGTATNASVVESCVVRTCGGAGIWASDVSNCDVRSVLGGAIWARVVRGSVGECVGASVGIFADEAVSDSHGSSESNFGIRGGAVSNCRGVSRFTNGIDASVVLNSIGISGANGVGINASTVNFSRGTSATGSGITASVANGCTIGGGTTNIVNKYNMP